MRQRFAWLFAIAVAVVLDHTWALCSDTQSAFARAAQAFARVDPPAAVLSASGVLLTSNSGSRAQADRPVTGQQAVVRQGAATPAGPPPPRDFSGLAGPYLGQAPPGTIPQVFAPNAVSTTARELNSVFTPDGSEFYFTIQGEDGRWTIMRTALEHGRWTVPTPASFSGKWSDVDLFITADGRQLYFCSNRPVQGDALKDFDIWVSDRAGAGWSDPRNLGAPINSPAAEFHPTLTRDGTMYFQSQRPGGHGAADIWRARLREGRYVEAECLPGPVNTSGFEGDAFIALDESYLIVSTRVGTLASSAGLPAARPDGVPAQAPPPPPAPPPPGLFVSVLRSDGTWSALVSLGDAVNSARAGVNCQMLSPDGRYLFFTRGGDIYWVDAAVLEQAKRRALDAARRAHQGIGFGGYTDLLGFAGFLNRLSEEHGVTAEASGAHAGESETSMMLALEPDLVVRDRWEPGYLGPLGAAEVKRILERGMLDLTANGVLGDPRGARAERGVTYLERLAESLVEHLERAAAARS
jgi:hypothetical protein